MCVVDFNSLFKSMSDIKKYRLLQNEFKVASNYMNKRTIITAKMRAILVDWLVQVHLRFRLLQETLYITISILDRFLSVSSFLCWTLFP